jgi:hypothetical protein
MNTKQNGKKNHLSVLIFEKVVRFDLLAEWRYATFRVFMKNFVKSPKKISKKISVKFF